MLLGVGVLTIWAWLADKTTWVRLSDTKVPNNGLMLALALVRIRQRVLAGPLEELRKAMEQMGGLLGERMRQSDERATQELALQRSLENFARAADDRDQRMVALQEGMARMTQAAEARDRRLLEVQEQVVALTVVLGVLGLATIGLAIWAALR